MAHKLEYYVKDSDFLRLFAEADLTATEALYFVADIPTAMRIECKSIKDYYTDNETQSCLIEHADRIYRDEAISGLTKILETLERRN